MVVGRIWKAAFGEDMSNTLFRKIAHVFGPVTASSSWAAKGIYGEREWLVGQPRESDGLRKLLRFLMATGVVGFIILAWGLWKYHGWATLCGTILIIMAQLWRIDRLGILYEQGERHDA